MGEQRWRGEEKRGGGKEREEEWRRDMQREMVGQGGTDSKERQMERELYRQGKMNVGSVGE